MTQYAPCAVMTWSVWSLFVTITLLVHPRSGETLSWRVETSCDPSMLHAQPRLTPTLHSHAVMWRWADVALRHLLPYCVIYSDHIKPRKYHVTLQYVVVFIMEETSRFVNTSGTVSVP